MSDKIFAVAVDGPSGAGKSTLAKAVAANILLKLYLKSLKNGGKLQLDEHIPYTAHPANRTAFPHNP